MSEFEVVRGFSLEDNKEGRYDYDYLLNKPGRASTEADGLAPQLSGDQSTFLRGDGEWAEIPVYAEATQQAAGLMSKEDKKKVDNMGTTISNAISVIDFPVDSVNGKTGAVILDSDAVGAVSKETFEDEIELKADVVKEVNSSVVALDDSADAPLQGLKLYGKTVQNGIPTPTTPVPLESVGADGNVAVSVCGANILRYPYSYSNDYTERGIRFTVDEDGIITANGQSTNSLTYSIISSTKDVVTLPAGEYFLSGCPAGGSGSTYSIVLRNADRSVQAQDVGRGAPFVLTKEEQLHCTVYFAKGGIAAENLVFKPMLNVGKSAMPFEPYTTQTLTAQKPEKVSVFLPGIKVSSGGNYTDENDQQWICDEIDFARGKYVQRVYFHVVNGSTSLTLNSGSKNDANGGKRFSAKLPKTSATTDPSALARAMCSHIATLTTQNSNYHYTGAESVYSIGDADGFLSFRMNGINTVADMTAFLTQNPMTVIYELASPIEHDLTAEEIAQYSTLHTHYPNTTIYNDSGASMEVTYATPTTALPLTGGRYKVSEPYAPTDAVPKSYADRIDKKVDTLREVVSKFHSNIVQEADGKLISVSDASDEHLQNLKLFGKTTQFTTTGKNLLNLPDKETTTNGITFTCKNGEITMNGTATASAFFTFVDCATMAKDETYYYQSNAVDGVKQFLGANSGNYNEAPTFYTNINNSATSSADGMVDYQVYVISGTVLNNVTVKPQLTVGTSATAWEPYTGGIPSPNPDYPQELETVGADGNVAVTVCGKNLLDENKLIGVATATRYTEMTEDGRIHFVNTDGEGFERDVYVALPPGTYTVRARLTTLSGLPYLGCNATGTTTWFNYDSYSFTLTETTSVRFRITTSNTRDAGEYYVNLWLTAGSVQTEYEPYKEPQTLTAQTPNGLPGIPVSSGGNYTDANGQQWICDEIDFARGKYVQRVELKRIVSSAAWTASTQLLGRYFFNYKYNDVALPLCTHFKTMLHATTAVGELWSNQGVQLLFNTSFATLDEWKAYLDNNEVYVLLGLKKENPIPLSEIDPDALAQYSALHTNYPNTTIYNDGGAGMEVKYVADTKIYIDKKFEELAEILVNKL